MERQIAVKRAQLVNDLVNQAYNAKVNTVLAKDPQALSSIQAQMSHLLLRLSALLSAFEGAPCMHPITKVLAAELTEQSLTCLTAANYGGTLSSASYVLDSSVEEYMADIRRNTSQQVEATVGLVLATKILSVILSTDRYSIPDLRQIAGRQGEGATDARYCIGTIADQGCISMPESLEQWLSTLNNRQLVVTAERAKIAMVNICDALNTRMASLSYLASLRNGHRPDWLQVVQ